MSPRRIRLPLFLCLFILSRASGLIYEIVLCRRVIRVIGGTTFAITTVLARFTEVLAPLREEPAFP